MKVRLLEPHVIGAVMYPVDAAIELPPGVRPTPLMLGLDDEARTAIEEVRKEAFGRWVWSPVTRHWHLLDDPPIQRPITDPQPEHPIPSGGPRER